MNKVIILLLMLLIPTSIRLKAQVSVNTNIGYGWYQMKDMKDLADNVLNGLNQEMGNKLKMTDNFPAYITYSGEVTFQQGKHEIGILGGYMSTGARFAYSDYSGRYTAKIVADALKLGVVYKYHFYETNIATNPFSVFASMSPSLILTNVNITEEMQLYEQGLDQKSKDNIIDSKSSISIQPMVGCRLTLVKRLLIHMSAGRDFNLSTNFSFPERVDWSGFRINGGVGVMF